MKKKKRYLMDAYKAFRETPEYREINPLLGDDGVKREYKLYDKIYPLFDTEEEINKEFCDYVKAWAEEPEYRAVNGGRVYLDSGYSTYRKNKAQGNVDRPSDVAVDSDENVPVGDSDTSSSSSRGLSGDDIRGKRSDRYKNPDKEKDAEAQMNSDAARSKEIELEYEAKKKAGKDNTIPYDEDAVKFEEASEGLRKLQELDSHLVSILGLSGITDTKNVKRSVNNIKDEGDYETYGDAMKTASTIVELCNRIKFNTSLVKDSRNLAIAVINSDAGYFSKIKNVLSKGKKGVKGGSVNDTELHEAYVRLSGRSHKLDKLSADELIRFIKEIKSNYPKEVSWFKYVNGTLENEALTKRSYDRAAGDSGYISMWNEAWTNVNKRLGNMSRPGDVIELSDKLLNSGLMPGSEKGLNDLKTIAGAKALQMGVNAGESQGFNVNALNVGGEKK